MNISFQGVEVDRLLIAAGIVHGRLISRLPGQEVRNIGFHEMFYKSNPRMARLCNKQPSTIMHTEMGCAVLGAYELSGAIGAEDAERVVREMQSTNLASSEEDFFERLGDSRPGITSDLVYIGGHIYLGERPMSAEVVGTQMDAFLELSRMVHKEFILPDKALNLFARLYRVLPP